MSLTSALFVVVGVGLSAHLSQRQLKDEFALQREASDRDAARTTREARLQADLADLRLVLDGTARHLARATRAVDVLRDRCDTAVKENVAPSGGPAATGSPVYTAWQQAVDRSYDDIFALRVDRERLRIRLERLELFRLFAALERRFKIAREPCVRGRLKANASVVTDDELKRVRRLTTSYFKAVVATAGTQIKLSRPQDAP